MSIVLQNRLAMFAQILRRQIERVISVHQDGIGFDAKKYKAVESQYFEPALKLITEGGDNNRESTGTAWVQFSLGMVLLYVPDIPFDPAIRQHVDHSRFLVHAKAHETQLLAWNLVKEVFFGPGSDSISAEMIENDGTAMEVSKPSTYRPSVSEAASLHQEWMALVDSSVGQNAVEKLTNGTLEQRKIWQSNTLHSISRIRGRYQSYADITDIFDGIVCGMKLGFDLLSGPPQGSDAVVSSYWLLDPAVLATKELENVVANVFKQSNGPLSLEPEFLLQILSALAVQTHVTNQPVINSLVMPILSDFHLKWKLLRKKEEEQEIANSSVFVDDTAEAVEEEFLKMFPDYEGDASSDLFNQKKSSEDEMNYRLAHVYMKLYGARSGTFEDSIMSGVDVVTSQCSLGKPGTYDIEKVLPAAISSLYHLTKPDIDGNKNFNFYHESSQAETDRVIALVHRIKQASHDLLKRWPEHQTLQEIHLACKELLLYPVNTPVARFLQKVDQIYVFLNQWEENASREVSLSSVISDLTKLIVDWRSLELRTWSKLFEFEQASSEKEIGKWWFHLYESIIVKIWDCINTNTAVSTTELVQALTVFVSSSTIGQYTVRLNLLRAFVKNVDYISAEYSDAESVSIAIRNVIQFYEQYIPAIEGKLKKESNVLQQKVNEKIKLVTFKDTNPAALKQSTKKSHHDLHKIVRQFRALISEKVTSIVDGPPPPLSRGFSGYSPPEMPSCPSNEPHKQTCKVIPACKSRSDILLSEKTVRNMHLRAENVRSQEFETLQEFVQSTVDEITNLKKETPSILTEENKKLVSQLRSEKGKLLSDSLKSLKQAGLSTNVKAAITESQAKISVMLGETPSLEGRKLGNADGEFFRILEMLPRLRSAVVGSESDVPYADLQRGLAISENLMAKLLSVRTQVSKHFTDVDQLLQLKEAATKLSSLFGTGDSIVSQKLHVDRYLDIVKWIPEVVGFVSTCCHQTMGLTNAIDATALDIFAGITNRSKDLIRQLESYRCLYQCNMVTRDYGKLVGSIRNEMTSFVEEMTEWGRKYKNLAFAGDMLINWIHTALSTVEDSYLVKSEKTDHTIQDLEVELQKLCNFILMVFQAVDKLFISHEENDDQWFTQSLKQVVKSSRLLQLRVVNDQLAKIFKMVSAIGALDSTSSESVVAMVGSCLPFIYEYSQLCDSVSYILVNCYGNTAKSANVLFSILHELASNGFCTPQEKQPEEKDSGKTESGTGLGDGAGAQDHSQDIEDDEDLSEHAQKDNEDQNKDEEKDKDEEDNAVDIEGDMAGELEDAPDQDKEEDDDSQDNEDEEQEPDEELGDIDDMDPDAIDEKMWNDDSEEKKDEKEKQSDKLPDNSKDDDDMQGNDDENLNDQQSKDNDQDEGQDEQDEQDENAEDEDDVGEQEDDIQQQQGEELEPQAEDTDMMQLPDDMNLDGEDEEKEEQDQGEEDMEDMSELPPENEEMQNDNSKDDSENENEHEADNEDEDKEAKDEDGSMDVDDEQEDGEKEDKSEHNENEDDNDDITDNTKSNEAEEQMNVDTEGLYGPDDAEDDANADQSTTGKKDSQNKSEGVDQNMAQEQEYMDDGGQGMSSKPEDKDPKEDDESMESKDQAQKEAEESMKQLGDALKEFHKRRQDIKEVGEQDDTVEDTSNERPDEFEHLDEGEQSAKDTQALGSADQEQVQKIDDNMAIDDDELEDKVSWQDEEQTAHEQNPIESDDKNQEPTENGDMPSQGMSSVGERFNKDEQPDQGGTEGAMDLDDDEDEDQVIDVQQVDDEGQIMTPPRSIDEARDLWRKYEIATQDLAMSLCEQLRLILEPTQATKLRGDFKTGKRLNMKRIIPYIASQFKKDKIWMRRTKPSKRQYQIMIAVDDSKSMSESQSVDLAFQTIALVSKALTQLEAGQLGITRFGDDTHMVHPFQKPFSPESGAEVLQWFGFDQNRTNVKRLLDKSIKSFDEARSEARQDLWQLEIIISDGICEDHDRLRQLVRRAQDERIMMVFVVVDGINKDSILDLTQVNYVTDSNGNQKMQMQKYLDKFPFEYYVIVRDIRELPGVLSLVLRQYFSEVSEA